MLPQRNDTGCEQLARDLLGKVFDGGESSIDAGENSIRAPPRLEIAGTPGAA
jgi:hypothetical protein